jgi:hypothetical protein
MRRVRSEAEVFESAKARGLMQVIERIIARHNRGECRLDEETFRLFEVAKSIKWANNNREFLEAIGRLETPTNSWLPEDRA